LSGCSRNTTWREAAESRDYSSGQLVGIDLDRRRSVFCRIYAVGELLPSVRIDNDRAALLREVGKAGPGASAAIEATYGWYWAASHAVAADVRGERRQIAESSNHLAV
jgi:hypothetical protein